MNTIIEMAHEAGWKDLRDYDSEMHEDIFMGSVDSLKAFAALVRADEREANAKMVDHILKEGGGTWGDAIRARGNT